MKYKNMKLGRTVYSMDPGWLFHLGDVELHRGISHNDIYGTSKAGSCPGVPQPDFYCDPADWKRVDLPHDWSVKLPFDKNGSPSRGYKPKGKAWYRKQFALGEELKDKNITLEFDGAAKDCFVYFNGSLLKRHYSSYAPFTVDITDRAYFDGTPNVLAVYLDAEGWEGWWYEGAGLYRHVRLVAKEKVSVAQYGIFVCPRFADGVWSCPAQVTLENTGYSPAETVLHCEILNKHTGEVIAADEAQVAVESGGRAVHMFDFAVKDPELWDIDSPNLYTCRVWLGGGADGDSVDFGFRTIRFDAEKGFFLNGRNVKIFGTCNHQDHGGIGVAIPDSVHKYRISRLKEMGTNAYRCAHGMPHAELLDECDRAGMLVMNENRSFETSEQCLEELRTMILRDRNHPSVIMWSIFNEEPLQGTEQGRRMAQRMRAEIHRLDDSRFVTGAMNGGVTEADSAAQALDVAGMNYQLYAYDEFHAKFPEIPVIGSETTSTFAVRGCYKTEMDKHLISCYDEDPADWGNTVRQTWQTLCTRDFAAGGFMWTGFDYLGEPTPFEYPSVSSFFGMMDTCGFAKDAFWLCKSIFTPAEEQPVVHLLPHWNFKGREGEKIRVMSHTNCEEAELFVNGRSLGRKRVDKLHQTEWQAEYRAGEIKLIGYNKGIPAAECVRQTTGEAARIKIECANVSPLEMGGLDAAIVNFIAVDCEGREVPDFCGEIAISAEGGEVIGTANGDPNCHEPFDSARRSLFNGRAQAIIRPAAEAALLTISAECGKLMCDALTIKLAEPSERMPVVLPMEEIQVTGWRVSAELSEEKPDPLKVFAANDMNTTEPYFPSHGNGSKMAEAVGKYALFRAHTVIPETLGGREPRIHFNQLWGRAEVWVNGKKRLDFENEWAAAAEIPCTPDMTGSAEITVIVQSINKYGAGVTSTVVVR